MPADKSALGTLPAAALQYCEALRVASGFGWYIFPPKDISLMFDGSQVFYADDDDWSPLHEEGLGESFEQGWRDNAPKPYKDLAPPYLRTFFMPGVVQVWSGWFVATRANWGVNIRPIVNVHDSNAFRCYEGIVDTDEFQPCPLFINIKLCQTNVEIRLPKDKPLFQVQPIQRESYSLRSPKTKTHIKSCLDMDWTGLDTTFRIESDSDDAVDRTVGQYAGRTRKRKN